uniref:Prefoldin subunit alpha n=1 Tax=Ignisphaera aggregans TaxID=334771 RepID=A0A7C4D3M2_9CREN
MNSIYGGIVSNPDRIDVERAVQQLLVQLEELRAAIRILQNRSLALTSEIQEIRIAYETLTNIQQHSQRDVMASLDRQGYVYVKVKLEDIEKAVVRIGRDFYVFLPIDNAKNVLLNFEKDVMEELRRTEAELKQLTSIYEQLQTKLQEYLALLSKEEKT